MPVPSSLRTPGGRSFVESFLPLLLLLLILASSMSAFAAPPTLTSLNPAGGRRGTKFTVTCSGAFNWPVSVFAPGLDVNVGSESGKLDISIPPDLQADRVWIRLYNPEGASNLLPFLIGNRTEVAEVEPNDSPQAPQEVPKDIVVNGALQKGGDVDGFAIDLLAGETLVAALDAHTRLGSPMDAMMQIVTPDRFVLAENNDEIGLDPRIAYTARHSGRHLVRIFAFPSDPNSTIAFAGAPNYIYRLTLTTGPFLTHAAPSSVPIGNPETVEVFGWNVSPHTILPVLPWGGPRLADALELEVQAETRSSTEERFGLAWMPDFPDTLRVRMTPGSAHRGIVLADQNAPPLLVPDTTATGCLTRPFQTDHFRIPLKGSQRLLLTVETRSIDSILDAPIVKLLDSAGKMVAEINKPTPEQVYQLAYVSKGDETFRLTVQDRLGHGGDQNFYRLTVRVESPDFELSGTSDSLVLSHDKPTDFVVNVVRRAGATTSVGPITVEAVDLPPGVTAPAVVSQTNGETASKVTLSFTSSGLPYSGRIRIVGKATELTEISRDARTPPNLGVCFDRFWLTTLAKPQ